jgi:hypothetical protein
LGVLAHAKYQGIRGVGFCVVWILGRGNERL